jgi:hypothetical protein
MPKPTRDRARKPRRAQGSSKPLPHAKSPERMTPEQEPVAEVPHISYPQRTGSPDIPTEPEQPRRIPSPEARPQLSPSVESNVNRLKDALTYQAPVGVKPVAAPRRVSDPKPVNGVIPTSAQSRRALPGMASPALTPLIAPRPITPTSSNSSPEEAPSTPSRHSRIPSSGQRATVMDVAQALQEHEQHIRESSLTPEPELSDVPDTTMNVQVDDEIDETPRTDVQAVIAGWGRNIGSTVQQAERRRSTYDRYSVTTLPPLLEEKTPIPTPQGSLSRGFTQVEQPLSNVRDIHESLQEIPSTGEAPPESLVPVPVVDVEQELEEPLIHLGGCSRTYRASV